MMLRTFSLGRPTAASSSSAKSARNLSSVGADVDFLGGMQRRTFYRLTENFSPFINSVFGPTIEAASAGLLSIKLSRKKVFIGNPAEQAYHGGVVSTMIDHTAGFCAWTT